MRQVKVNSVTGSDSTLVPTSDVKNYIRVDHSVDDSLIADMVKQSRIVLENFLSRDIIAKTRTYYLDESNGLIDIPFGPIASIDSVTVDGSTATHTVVGLDKETIELDSSPSYVTSNRYPYTYEKIKISYTTSGISDTLIKNAIMQMVATFYDNRADFKTGTIVSEIPMTAKKMVASFKSMYV